MTSVGVGTGRRASADRLVASGGTDPGVQREVNEDRFHVDVARGVFLVIDGIGGQAAGGRAADVALSMVRERLERETGSVADRIREAIAVANNEICRLASTRAEWKGMACVLTIAVVTDGKVTIGHVGDTRLYKIRNGSIGKITRDHSPVGEREDAGELSESQAMRHPRRNEVYRDVGSEPHAPDDLEFVDIEEVAFEPDAALLLCTDGLTDLVDSASIARVVSQRAGDPDGIVGALIDAANAAGGKDNVTVVYVEGERFSVRAPAGRNGAGDRFGAGLAPAQSAPAAAPTLRSPSRARHGVVVLAILTLLAIVVVAGLLTTGFRFPVKNIIPSWFGAETSTAASAPQSLDVRIVQPNGSIAEALRDAVPGSQVIVEPGEYREQLVLTDGVRLVSRVPRGATIRLPASVPDRENVPAVVASGLSRAELVGFRIVGDSATPLAVGIGVDNAALAVVDVEIAGATRAAVEFSGAAAASLLGCDLHDNPGAAIVVHGGAAPRIAHSVFARNASSERATSPLVVQPGGAPHFNGNVFVGLNPDTLGSLDNAARTALKNENWFVPVSQRRTSRGPASGRPQPSR